VCHQSVGLIARALEAAGIVTTSLTSAWTITASANPPRAAFTDFPLGNTAGPPNRPDVQLDIVRSALALAHDATSPGEIVPLGVGLDVFPDGWKDEARELVDHRTPRESTPQYQSSADREAAVARHGEASACSAC